MSLQRTKSEPAEPVRFPPKPDHQIRWLLVAAAIAGVIAWATWPAADETSPFSVRALMVRVAAGHVDPVETRPLLESIVAGDVAVDDLLDYDPGDARGRELVLVFHRHVEQLVPQARAIERHRKLIRLDPGLADAERQQRLAEVESSKQELAQALSASVSDAAQHIATREAPAAR